MASLRHQRRKQCGSKVRWATLELAKAQAHRLRRFSPGGLSSYKCPVCNGFHVGHTPRESHQYAAKTLQQVTGYIARLQ